MNLCQRTVDPRNFTHSDDVVFSVSTTRNLHRFGEIVPCLSANEKNETTLNPHCFSSRSTRYSELLGSLQVWILYSTVANNGTDIIESTATRCTAQNSTNLSRLWTNGSNDGQCNHRHTVSSLLLPIPQKEVGVFTHM